MLVLRYLSFVRALAIPEPLKIVPAVAVPVMAVPEYHNEPLVPVAPVLPVAPLRPCAPLGMPKLKLNTLAVLDPDDVTLTVASEPASRVVAVAVGVPNPAAAPVSPLAPVLPVSPLAPLIDPMYCHLATEAAPAVVQL